MNIVEIRKAKMDLKPKLIEIVDQTVKLINATVIVSFTHDCVILAIQVPQKWTLKDWVVTSMDKRRKGSMTTGIYREGCSELTIKDPGAGGPNESKNAT